MGAGLFVGSLPLYGLHLPLLLAVCLPARLDAVVAYAVACFNNPLTAPFLLALQVEVGSLVLTGEHAAFDVERARAVGVGGFAVQGAVGAVVVAVCLAVVGGGVVSLALRARRASVDPLDEAQRRTVARYVAAGTANRAYVSTKLATDPLVRDLARLAPLGEVVDLGCGRGQLVLALVDAGAVTSVRGFDSDGRKVAIAQAAGGTDGEFVVADVRSLDLPAADTILLIDVLHYLTLDEQDAVLRMSAAALRPGGRVVVRELDGSARGYSLLGRLAERVAMVTGYNRGRVLTVRPIAEIVRVLEAEGLDGSHLVGDGGSLLGNAIVVGVRPVRGS